MTSNQTHILSFFLAIALATIGLTPESIAAAPSVMTDETAYVTLDYYGATDYLSIVKSCALNGMTTFSDYGKYSSVRNMTTLDQPIISEDLVDWTINENVANRFYYEVVPEEQSIILPWKFDISYRLNGASVSGESLAGASGLVEIEVTVTPNPRASTYLKNNFMLLLGAMSSTEDNKSFSAPGAQLQSIGCYQAGIYLLLPKQEKSVTFSIGSDCFESPGLAMMMVPITFFQFDDLSQMQEHKENLEGSSNAIDAVFDDLFSIMNGMRSGISTTTEGLDQLEEARQQIDKNRDTIKSETKDLITALERFRKVTWHFGDELDDSRLDNTIKKLGDSFGELVTALGGMGEGVEELKSATGSLEKLMVKLEKSHDLQEQQGIVDKIGDQLVTINTILEKLQKIGVMGGLDSGTFEQFREVKHQLNQEEINDEQARDLIDSLLATMNEQLYEMNRSVAGDLQTTMGLLKGMQDMQSNIYTLSTDTSVILNEASDMMLGMADLLQPMITSVKTLDDTLCAASDPLNNGTRLTLSGMTRMLNDLSAALNKTQDLQKQKDIIATIIRDEWNRFDKDLSILDVDTKAEKRSFTSTKNPAPTSLQIVLRTHEIELEDKEVVPVHQEDVDIGILGRIEQVFVKLASSVKNIFS